MSKSMKIAGKSDNDLVTPVSVTTEGYVREERKFRVTTTDIVNEALNITEKTYYPSYDASNSGIIAIQIWNRTGVSLTIQFYNPATNNSQGNAVAEVFDVNGNIPKFIIQNSMDIIITADDLPLLNYAKYINISLTPSETPTGANNTVVRVFDKR